MLFATQVAVRILHLMLPTAYWSFSEKLLHAAIIYLFVLLFWFSALRMHKAKILWQNSFLRELFESLVRQSRTVSFVQRMTVYYLLFLLVNLAGAVTASFLLLHGKSLNARLEASFLILLFGASNSLTPRASTAKRRGSPRPSTTSTRDFSAP